MNDDNFCLSVHHIGGRSGTRVFPLLPSVYEKNLENVLYEADKECIEDIEQSLSRVPSKNVILPYCIAAHTGKSKFYLLADRYESSLIKPNIDHSFYSVEFGWDHDMKGYVDEICEFETITLDDLYSNKHDMASPPDFLSLDAEKAEPQILAGSENLLKSEILAVQSEFGLLNTFNDLMNIMCRHEFDPVEVQFGTSSFSFAQQVPIGLRAAKGSSPEAGEIIFFKDAEAIISNHKDPLLDLLKAAFIAFVMFNFKGMYIYLHEFRQIKGSKKYLEEICGKKDYLKFLKLFMEMYDTYPKIVPLRFSSVLPTSECRGRQRFSNKWSVTSEELRKQYFQYVDLTEFKRNIFSLYTEEYIGVERLCKDNKFDEHAELIKKTRLYDLLKLLNPLELTANKDNDFFLHMDNLQKL